MAVEAQYRDYLNSIGVQDLVDDMVAALLENRPSNPSEFLIHFLEEGRSNGFAMKSTAPASTSGGRAKSSMRGGHPTVNWREVTAKLPTKRDPESKAKRDKLFALFDPNGNHYLSLAEVDKGLRDILQLDDLFNCKPAIMRAFQAAKDVHKETKARLGHDFITKCEFRILLVYLRRYFELFVMFDKIDLNSDRRLDFNEFKQAMHKLEAWGLKVYYPEQQFKALDKNGGGMILFDEFSAWAIEMNLDLEEDDDDDDDEVFTAARGGNNAGRKAVKGAYNQTHKTIDWAKIAAKLPSSNSKVDQAKRDELFKLFDPNGNKYLSLAEVDKGLRDIVQLDDVYDAKPAIMRAFQAAKGVNTNSRARLGADFITRSEFRVLMEYLKKYFQLFVMFDHLDVDSDRRINVQEFTSAARQLESWGVKVSNPAAEFRSIDKNGGGQILFEEFCHWAIAAGLDMGTLS